MILSHFILAVIKLKQSTEKTQWTSLTVFRSLNEGLPSFSFSETPSNKEEKEKEKEEKEEV